MASIAGPAGLALRSPAPSRASEDVPFCRVVAAARISGWVPPRGRIHRGRTPRISTSTTTRSRRVPNLGSLPPATGVVGWPRSGGPERRHRGGDPCRGRGRLGVSVLAPPEAVRAFPATNWGGTKSRFERRHEVTAPSAHLTAWLREVGSARAPHRAAMPAVSQRSPVSLWLTKKKLSCFHGSDDFTVAPGGRSKSG